MNFTVKVKMNSANQIIRDHGLDENGRVTQHLRGVVDRFCDPYIPMSSGSGAHMKNNKTYPNNHSIKYAGPYAHYHYKGELMLALSGSSWAKFGETKKYSGKKMKYNGAPKRGPEWDKRMMNDRGKEVCKDVENFIKNGGK